MSDSVDRVFVHALNTVKKIPRAGSVRPPPADRLKLYGLYKQSMEGDVARVMDRPMGNGGEADADREKWDAWNQHKGLSKTEAKRRYIPTLIDTMHKYASATPDARELVSELEFIWDQIKSNVPSSSASSPIQPHSVPSQNPPTYQSISGERGPQMDVLSPASEPPEGEDDHEVDEFDDALSDVDGRETEERDDGELKSGPPLQRRGETQRNHKWRRRVEQALTKVTAEVAALREQIEMRKAHKARKRRSLRAWIVWVFWFISKHIIFDAVLLGLLLLWMRVRRDRRLAQALKMVFGSIRESLRRVQR
ncbi:MAG: hypothetical protein M1839_009283 [Geoglossum umbratile]|nr:MAG: hypothetical protein M1839_009283 [Geoglossum umbratile]